jgi:hypothetical protein
MNYIDKTFICYNILRKLYSIPLDKLLYHYNKDIDSGYLDMTVITTLVEATIEITSYQKKLEKEKIIFGYRSVKYENVIKISVVSKDEKLEIEISDQENNFVKAYFYDFLELMQKVKEHQDKLTIERNKEKIINLLKLVEKSEVK